MFDKIKLNEFMEGELSFHVCKFFAIIESLFLGCLFQSQKKDANVLALKWIFGETKLATSNISKANTVFLI